MISFYTDLVGFKIVDLRDPFKGKGNPPEYKEFGDCTAYFTRYASDHHALVFYNHRYRMALGVIRMGLWDDVLRFGGGQAAG